MLPPGGGWEHLREDAWGSASRGYTLWGARAFCIPQTTLPGKRMWGLSPPHPVEGCGGLWRSPDHMLRPFGQLYRAALRGNASPGVTNTTLPPEERMWGLPPHPGKGVVEQR